MKRGFKALAVLAALVAASAGPQLFAFCDSNNELPAIFQCAERAWFEAPPAGSGAVSGVFWGIGFGNNTINDGLDSRGYGISGKSTFNGNDSGIFAVDLLDAGALIAGAPANSVCLGSNNWANAGVDGCADHPRDAAQPFTDDNYLNPEFDVYANRTGYPGVASTAWMQDAPMAVLMTESSGHFFALAAATNMIRTGLDDFRGGFFDFGQISNGTLNPITGRNNNVPWQRIPGDRDGSDPSTQFVRSAAIDANNNRVLDLGWNGAVVHSDQSVKPSSNTVVNAIGLSGVGVLDHGNLVRYVVESQAIVNPADPIGSLNPLGWSALSLAQVPDGSGGFTAQTVVAPDTCLRLHTYFGAVPQSSGPYSSSLCRQGVCGDLGYEVVSGPACVGGALAADGVIRNARAVRGKGGVDVEFDSQSELSVRSYKIYALTQASGSVEVADLSCTECTTGGGGNYKARIPMGQLKGARELEIVSSTGSRVKVSIK
jgi:hypothetical protein